MSDIPSYQGKALGTRLLSGQGSRRVPGRRYRRADGVESYYSPSPRRPAKATNAATTGAAVDEIATSDGAGSHSLGDQSQHGPTFKLPRCEIADKPSLHRGIEELADLSPTLDGHFHQRDEFGLHDSRNVEGETSSVTVSPNLDQRNDKKLVYEAEVSNPADNANSEGPDNMDVGESVSSSKQYETPWPRTRHELGSRRSGYIPPSIAERISAHDEPVNPTNMNVLARLIQPSSAPVVELEAGRTSSPSILSKPANAPLFRAHYSQEAAANRRQRILRRQPPIHRGDLPARPAPAALPHTPMIDHNLTREPDHIARVARDIAMPAVAHVRNSTTDRELGFKRNVVTLRPGGDIQDADHLHDHQLQPVATSYDGIINMHSYNTDTPVEPSTLESIYEDASDEPTSTTPRVEKPSERGNQKVTARSSIESARKSGEYLRVNPPALEPSVVSSDPQSSTASKPTERGLKLHESRKLHADKSQASLPLEGVVTKVEILEHPTDSKRGWPPYKRILPVKSASSSVYSQPESHSLMSDIRAAFIRGEEDTHRYERLGYHHEDSKRTVEAIFSKQHVGDASQKETHQSTRSSEPKSPLESANVKPPTSQYTTLFARRPSRRAGALEQKRNSSTQRVRRRRVPFKSSQLKRFSRRFRPGRSSTSLKNTGSEEELLALKAAMSEENETNSTAADKEMPAISEKKSGGPKNWFEGILSFHKKGTDQSTSLPTNQKSDARLNEEVIMSGFIPYDKHTGHSGSIWKRDMKDTEILVTMIENLERRLDEALYPAHKAHDAAVAVDVPQQKITGGVDARTNQSAPIRHSSRYIQQGGSEGEGRIEKGDLRSHSDMVSYGYDRNDAMGLTPPVASNLHSKNAANVPKRVSGALHFTSTAPFPKEERLNPEAAGPDRGIISDLLSDNVTLNPTGDTRHNPGTSSGDRMKPVDPDYYYPSRGRPQRRPSYKTAFSANLRRRATVIPRLRDREMSKERILRFVKAYNVPPIQPRRSSRGMGMPSRDSFQGSDGPTSSRYSERALRVHTSMDGAHEADDEMESEVKYITPRRRKRNRQKVRRRSISYEEAHHMHFLHGERETSGQIFEWPPHIIPTQIRDDQGSNERGSNESSDSNGTQRVYVTARTRQNRGAVDLSPADERLVTVVAGFSVAFIYLLLCVYIAFGPDNRYALSI